MQHLFLKCILSLAKSFVEFSDGFHFFVGIQKVFQLPNFFYQITSIFKSFLNVFVIRILLYFFAFDNLKLSISCFWDAWACDIPMRGGKTCWSSYKHFKCFLQTISANFRTAYDQMSVCDAHPQDTYTRTSHLCTRFRSASLTTRIIPGDRRISCEV